MNNKQWALFVLVLAGVAGTVGAAENPTEVLYNQKCASCHGKDGKGTASMAKMFKLDIAELDLIDEATLEKKDEELDHITTKGAGKMPAYETKLKAKEISELTVYIRSLAKAKNVKPKS